MTDRCGPRTLLALAVVASGAAACGSTDDGTATVTAPASVSSSPGVSSTVAVSPPPPTASSMAPGTAPATAPSSTPGGSVEGLVPITVEIPTGSLEFGPDDVVVAERTGDLVVYRDLLAGVSDRRELLADYADPTGPVTEGPGPNVVDDVAGVIDGTLVFGDCCEPISGNVLVATGDPETVRPISPGYGPTLSPDGAQLASANRTAIQRSATVDGTGVARFLNQGPRPDGFLNVDDIAWVDDGRLALLGWDDAGYALFPVDAETLTIGEAVRFDAGDDEPGVAVVRFAGRAPDGELAVMVAAEDATLGLFFRATDLRRDETMGGARSPDVTALQRSPDGVGELWVEDGTLWWLPDSPPAAGPEPILVDPIELLDGVNGAWFPGA